MASELDKHLRIIVSSEGIAVVVEQFTRLVEVTTRLSNTFSLIGERITNNITKPIQTISEALDLALPKFTNINAELLKFSGSTPKLRIKKELVDPFKSIDDITPKVTARFKGLSEIVGKTKFEFKGYWLSIMFGARMIGKSFTNLFKDMISDYKKLVSKTSPLNLALTRLSVAFTYLKVSIVEAMSPSLTKFVDWVSNLIISFAEIDPIFLQDIGWAIVEIAGAMTFLGVVAAGKLFSDALGYLKELKNIGFINLGIILSGVREFRKGNIVSGIGRILAGISGYIPAKTTLGKLGKGLFGSIALAVSLVDAYELQGKGSIFDKIINIIAGGVGAASLAAAIGVSGGYIVIPTVITLTLISFWDEIKSGFKAVGDYIYSFFNDVEDKSKDLAINIGQDISSAYAISPEEAFKPTGDIVSTLDKINNKSQESSLQMSTIYDEAGNVLEEFKGGLSDVETQFALAIQSTKLMDQSLEELKTGARERYIALNKNLITPMGLGFENVDNIILKIQRDINDLTSKEYDVIVNVRYREHNKPSALGSSWRPESFSSLITRYS